MHDHARIDDFSINDEKFYSTFDVARSEVMDSVEVYKLFETIDMTDPNEKMFVDRLGIDIDKISFFLTNILRSNCQVKFISIKEYGLDPYKVGVAISADYNSRQLIAKRSSHCKPEKSLPVKVDDEMKQKMVNDNSKSI